jgi:hypothetical protein
MLNLNLDKRGIQMTHEFSLAHLTVLQCSPPEMVTIAARAGY